MKSKMIQRVSYALNAFGHNTFYVTLSTYLTVFVTSQVFAGTDKTMDAKVVATIISLVIGTRLTEIIFDPLIGGIIDNARIKYGKFRSWLAIGGVVSSVLLITIFTNFFGLATHSTTLFIVLFAAVLTLLGSFRSSRDITFRSMIPALSTGIRECEELATFARFDSSLSANSTTLVVVPIVTFFTYLVTHKHIEGASGRSWFGVIAVVISGGIATITTLGTKKAGTTVRQQNEKAGIKDVSKAVAQNDQLVWPTLAYIAYAIANIATTAVLSYFFKHVLGQPTEFWTVGPVAALLGLVTVPLFPTLTRVISYRYAYPGGIVMMVSSYFFSTTAGSSLLIVIIGSVLFYFPQQLIFLSALMTITDPVEYGQWEDDVHNEAITLSARPLLDKITGALPSGIAGFVVTTSRMIGNAIAADTTAHGITAFKAYAFYTPVALMTFSTVVFAWKITSTEKKHAQIAEGLESKLVPADTVEDEPHDAVVPSH